MKTVLTALMVALTTIVSGPYLFAQVSVTGSLPQTHIEDFNSLASSGSNITWTDNATLSGWYATEMQYDAETGSSTSGDLKSYGSSAATERALGSLASGSTNTIQYGVRFQNNTGTTISSISISYTGEQWRNATGTTNTTTFSYQQGSIVNSLSSGAYINETALDFTAPQSGSAGAIDGNLAVNQQAFSNVLITVSIPNGEEIMLRWTDPNETGSDQGLGIDDFSITFNGSACPAAGDLVINEIMYDPSGSEPTDEWIEICNTSAGDIDLDGLVLSDNTTSHTISSSVLVAAGACVVLARDAGGGCSTPDYVYSSLILNNSGEVVRISCSGAVIDSVDYDQVDFPNTTGEESIQLSPSAQSASANDIGSNWCLSTVSCGGGDQGTPGSPNNACAFPIVLNEIHFNPATVQGSDADYEFIEIFNTSGSAIDISGWTFSDAFSFTFPANTTISAGEYILLTSNSGTYAAFAPQVFDYGGSSLQNDGLETILLETSSGVDVFSVTYRDMDGAGTVDENWPDCADGRGPTLSLIDNTLTGAALYDDSNWAPSAYDIGANTYGSPGAANSTGCCLINAALAAECDNANDEYDVTIYFADAADTRDVFTLSNTTGSGITGGDDPNVLEAGAITVSNISDLNNFSFAITSTYGCNESFSLDAPNCEECSIVVTAIPTCLDEDIESYELEISLVVNDPLSSQIILEVAGNFQGLFSYSSFPLTLSPFTSTYQTGLLVEVTDVASEPQFTITTLDWDQGGGCGESITITNTGAPGNLLGYTLDDDFTALFGNNRHTFGDTVIPTNGTYMITAASFDPNGDGDLSDQECPIFNNSGDLAILSNPSGDAISALPYAGGTSPATQMALDPTEFCVGTTTFDEPCDAMVTPISLLYFSVSAAGRYAQLDWETSAELNNDFFLIERSSDGIQFTEIGLVNGAGTSDAGQVYQFIDSDLRTETLYYRLKQVDIDGTYSYSPIRVLSHEEKEMTFRLFPSPVSEQLTLQSSNITDAPMDIKIFNTMGQLLLKQVLAHGQVNHVIDVAGLRKGHYILRMSYKNEIQINRFVKE